MRLALFLFVFFAFLVGVLRWHRVPRQQSVSILSLSASLYALIFFLTLWGLARMAPDLTDGYIPYLPPTVLVGVFVAWSLHRIKAFQ